MGQTIEYRCDGCGKTWGPRYWEFLEPPIRGHYHVKFLGVKMDWERADWDYCDECWEIMRRALGENSS